LDKVLLLGKLPPFSNRRVVIDKKQSVYDIMREVLTAHRLFANDYDQIAAEFWRGTVYKTAQHLFDFCKRNIPYRVERENDQTTKSPAAILTLNTGDCKHYAGFIGGVLDALKRQGKAIEFVYRFAAYNGNGRTPEHVFIVAKSNGREIWIDPVLRYFDQRLQPSYYVDKKINMSLSRISGIGKASFNDYPFNDVSGFTQADYAIATLLKYGIMNRAGKINQGAITRLQKTNPAVYSEAMNAMNTIQQNAISGIFDTLLRGIKKVIFAAPRAAFLSLVGLNAFGYATKLHSAIYKADGTFTTLKDKIKDIWQNKFGGDFAALLNTVNNGYTKPAILGITPAVVTAWAAAAAAIIAAIMPIVKSFLNNNQTGNLGLGYNIDPNTGQPYTNPQPTNSIVDWITRNPVLVIGGIAAAYLLTTKQRAA